MVALPSYDSTWIKTMEFGGIWNTYVELSTTAFQNGHYDVAETMLRAAYRQAPKDVDGGFTRMAIVLENLAEVFVKQELSLIHI